MKSKECKPRGCNAEEAILHLRQFMKEKGLTSDGSKELYLCGGREVPYLVPIEGGKSEK